MLPVKCIHRVHLSHWEPFCVHLRYWEPFKARFWGDLHPATILKRYLCRLSTVPRGSKITTTMHTEYDSECRIQTREFKSEKQIIWMPKPNLHFWMSPNFCNAPTKKTEHEEYSSLNFLTTKIPHYSSQLGSSQNMRKATSAAKKT